MKAKRVTKTKKAKKTKKQGKSPARKARRTVEKAVGRARKLLSTAGEVQGLPICERLAHLLTRTSIVIYAAKTGGDYGATFVSDNVQKMTGYSYRSFISRPNFWFDKVHPDDREGVLSEVGRVFKSDYHEYEYRFKHKDGHYIWVHDEMRLIRDSKGKPLEIVGYWTDITRRKELEMEGEKRVNRISEFMESASEGFAMLDSQFNIIYVNKFLLRQFGLKAEQIVGVNYFDFTDVAYEIGQYEQYLEILETGRPRFFPDIVLPPTYGGRHVSIFVYRVGNCLGLIIKDVTEDVKRQNELNESEARFRSLYDSTNAGVVFQDVDGIVIGANKQAFKMLDINPSELIGAKLIDVCSEAVDADGNELKGEDHPVTKTLRTCQPVRNVIIGIPADEPDGKMWLLVNSELILDSETGAVDEVLCSFVDITEQKYVEDQLAESEERYRQIFENCPIGIGISDTQGLVVTANKAMQRITGYSLDEFKKVNLADTFENSEERDKMIKVLKEQGYVSDYHVRLLRRDGTPYDAVLNISRIEIGGKVYNHTMCHVITP